MALGASTGTETDAVQLVVADRATCFRDAVFDLVAFNPPYVPSDGIEDIAVDGGKGGVEVPLAFLREALRVAKPDGRVVMLLSSINPTEAVRRLCWKKGYVMKEIARKNLFYEVLSAYLIQRSGAREEIARHA